MHRLLYVVLTFCLIVGGVRLAGAEESSGQAQEQARELFKEGRRLFSEGDYQAASAKLEQSLKLDDGMGTRFHLAGCYEKLGKLASAHAMFMDVAERAKDAGQADREKAARERAQTLAPKLAKLRVDVADTDPKLEIVRGGVNVPASEWNLPVAVDPGSYDLGATSPGKKSWHTTAEVPEGPVLIVISVPKLESKEPTPAARPAKPAESAPAPAAADAPTEEPAPPAAGEGHKGMRTAAYIVGGVAVAGLVAGTTFVLQYQTSYNDARAVCRSSTNCTQQEIALHDSLVDDSKRSAALAYVGFGVGTVAALGATILFVSSSGERSTERQALRAAPVVAPDGSFGAIVGGSF